MCSICSVAVKAKKNHSTIGNASHQGGGFGVVHPGQSSAGHCGRMPYFLESMEAIWVAQESNTNTKRDSGGVWGNLVIMSSFVERSWSERNWQDLGNATIKCAAGNASVFCVQGSVFNSFSCFDPISHNTVFGSLLSNPPFTETGRHNKAK